jgi:hypothetical protein
MPLVIFSCTLPAGQERLPLSVARFGVLPTSSFSNANGWEPRKSPRLRLWFGTLALCDSVPHVPNSECSFNSSMTRWRHGR